MTGQPMSCLRCPSRSCPSAASDTMCLADLTGHCRNWFSCVKRSRVVSGAAFSVRRLKAGAVGWVSTRKRTTLSRPYRPSCEPEFDLARILAVCNLGDRLPQLCRPRYRRRRQTTGPRALAPIGPLCRNRQTPPAPPSARGVMGLSTGDPQVPAHIRPAARYLRPLRLVQHRWSWRRCGATPRRLGES